MNRARAWVTVAMLALMSAAPWAAKGQTAPPGPPNPALQARPAEKPPVHSAVAGAGRMRFDVKVLDASGQPVMGLAPWDFTVLDNGGVQKILTFRGYDGSLTKPNPPVETILVLDVLNLPFQQVSFMRQQVEQFLLRDGGKLKQPTTLMVLSDAGLRVAPKPILDGNALAGLLATVEGSISTINPAMGGFGSVDKFQRSLMQLTVIAENEARTPGRKLLIWIGPGWPLLDRSNNGVVEQKNEHRNFDALADLTNRLREARIAVYSVTPILSGTTYNQAYKAYLKPVRTPAEMDSGNLALKVFAEHTGGLVLGPDNDVAGQIARCVADANGYYDLSYNPPVDGKVGDFHELRVSVDRPGVTVRTVAGWYSEP